MTDMTAIARGHETIGAMLDARRDEDPATTAGFASQLAEAAHAAQLAASALAAHVAHPLIAALDETGLGRTLRPEQVTAVLGIVAMIEVAAPRQQQLMP